MPKKVLLKKPIVFGESGEPITELTFREEVVAGDLRGIAIRENMHWEDMLKLASRLCAQPEAIMNKLSLHDVQEVAALINGFFEDGPTTGTTPAPS